MSEKLNINSIEDLTSEIIQSYSSKEDFYESLLKFFKDKQYTTEDESDRDTSFAQIINKNADLDSEDVNQWNNILVELTPPHWNASIQDLLKFYSEHFNNNQTYYENEEGQIIDKDNNLISGTEIFKINDIKNADAGANFVEELDIYGENREIKNPWVIPWYNIDGETYRKVRSSDKIVEVLKNAEQLQFTRKTIEERVGDDNRWIRLLMPKNLRKVEVEDLNRNFWVIGQVLSAIGSYLFGPDGTIPHLLNSFLDEICQLWENIMYLWSGLGALSQEPYYNEVHCEVVPVPNDEWENFLKYDNFDTKQNVSDFSSYLQYLIDTYTGYNLCILPEVRMGNYEHNYYSKVYYPGFYFLNRNESESLQLIKWDEGNGDYGLSIQLSSGENPLWMNDVGVGAKDLYTLKENEETYSILTVDECEKTITESQEQYTSLIRVIYPIFYYDKGSNKIQFEAEIHDVIRDMIEGNVKIGGFSSSFDIDDCKNSILFQKYFISNFNNNQIENPVEIKKGFYQGELISGINVTKELNYAIEAGELITIPLLRKDLNSNLPFNIENTNKKDWEDSLWPTGSDTDESGKVYDCYNKEYSNFTNNYEDYGNIRVTYKGTDKTIKNWTIDTLQRTLILERNIPTFSNSIILKTAMHWTGAHFYSYYDTDSGAGFDIVPIDEVEFVKPHVLIENKNSYVGGGTSTKGYIAALSYPGKEDLIYYKNYVQNNFTPDVNALTKGDESSNSYFGLIDGNWFEDRYSKPEQQNISEENYKIWGTGITRTSYVFLKKKGEKLNSNNWIITRIQMDGDNGVYAYTDINYTKDFNKPLTDLGQYNELWEYCAFFTFYNLKQEALSGRNCVMASGFIAQTEKFIETCGGLKKAEDFFKDEKRIIDLRYREIDDLKELSDYFSQERCFNNLYKYTDSPDGYGGASYVKQTYSKTSPYPGAYPDDFPDGGIQNWKFYQGAETSLDAGDLDYKTVINAAMSHTIRVEVFTADGKYAQKIYQRLDIRKPDVDPTNQWKMVYETENFDEIRKGYVAFRIDGDNWEKYKTNGKDDWGDDQTDYLVEWEEVNE